MHRILKTHSVGNDLLLIAHCLEQSELPIVDEYIDNFSGRYANREDYQQMLTDARSGKFSHVAVENAERFGRNDAEATYSDR